MDICFMVSRRANEIRNPVYSLLKGMGAVLPDLTGAPLQHLCKWVVAYIEKGYRDI